MMNTTELSLLENASVATSPSAAPWESLRPRELPQPFPYQGSKRPIIREILALVPDGTDFLWEPFAGSAAVSVATMRFGAARTAVISDVNAPLMDLWRLIINDPDRVIYEYRAHWHQQLPDPRLYYTEARDEFNSSKDPVLLLYLLCRCVKAAVRYSRRTGDFNQGADHRRLGVKPDGLAERVRAASRIMQGADVQVGGYEERLLGARREDLVYMDPPYHGTSDVADHRYLEGLSRDVFIEVLDRANRRDVSFVLSYDAHTDDHRYGEPLPEDLGLVHLNIKVGTSSQATLNGRRKTSYESLYVSPACVRRLGGEEEIFRRLGRLGQTELRR